MLSIGILTPLETPLAEDEPAYVEEMRQAVIATDGFCLAANLHTADILILFEKTFFKTRRYLGALRADDWVTKAAERLFVINKDDFAHGLLPGLYTSLPASRYDPLRHRTTCYYRTPNEWILRPQPPVDPIFVGSFRGNVRGAQVRERLVRALSHDSRFSIETTDSWMRHSDEEKRRFVEQIRASAFSLCPRGWSPNSHRIYETMALGRVPVVIADDWEPPAGVEWLACSVKLPERSVNDIPSVLEHQIGRAADMGCEALAYWERFFAPKVRMVQFLRLLAELLERRPITFREVEKQLEWSSRKTLWSLGWTFEQRLSRRLLRFR